MSTSELEQVIQNYIVHQIHQSHIDPLMSAPSFSPSFSSSSSPHGTPKEHDALLATHPTGHRRLGNANGAGNYGALDSNADINANETDEESRGSHEEEQHQHKDAVMTEDIAKKEGRRRVMKALPILVIGVWEIFLSPALYCQIGSLLPKEVVLDSNDPILILHLQSQVLLAAIDTSVVTANYAIIGTELGALNLVSWIATA